MKNLRIERDPLETVRVPKNSYYGALASLIKKPTVRQFIPSIFDKRVVPTLANSLSR